MVCSKFHSVKPTSTEKKSRLNGLLRFRMGLLGIWGQYGCWICRRRSNWMLVSRARLALSAVEKTDARTTGSAESRVRSVAVTASSIWDLRCIWALTRATSSPFHSCIAKILGKKYQTTELQRSEFQSVGRGVISGFLVKWVTWRARDSVFIQLDGRSWRMGPKYKRQVIWGARIQASVV
jgi:hypothetical protein